MLGIVNTSFGKVRGVGSDRPEYRNVSYFKGIPYAAPPVGSLRWKPPVDPEPWDGVRLCDTYAPMARQNMGSGPSFEPWASDFYYMGHPKNDEDCLYLNITTAAEGPDEKRPVYLWFHGGGLDTGYSYEIEFDGSELARRGVVVVSVGQRLNIFGYLCCRQLSEEQGGKSGNYGLMDEVKALDWVYENIAAFGGDPDNITVGGQSGGTWKSGALAGSPYQRGRVKRVINQSALSWNVHYQSIAEMERSAAKYFEAIGLSPDLSLDELRALDSAVFYRPLPGGGFMDPDAVRIPGSMVCDGDYIESQDQAANLQKYAASCDYLSGVNYGEGAMAGGFFLGGSGGMSRESFYARAKSLIGEKLYQQFDFESLVPVTDENAGPVSRWLAARGLTGGFMNGFQSRYFGAYRKAKMDKGRTWAYIFTRIPPTRPEDELPGSGRGRDFLLSWHSAELWYTFSSLRKGVPPVRPWEDRDFSLAGQVCDYWANFMKTGNPNGNDLPLWPEADETLAWIELGDEILPHPEKDRLDDLILAYMKENHYLPAE